MQQRVGRRDHRQIERSLLLDVESTLVGLTVGYPRWPAVVLIQFLNLEEVTDDIEDGLVIRFRLGKARIGCNQSADRSAEQSGQIRKLSGLHRDQLIAGLGRLQDANGRLAG